MGAYMYERGEGWGREGGEERSRQILLLDRLLWFHYGTVALQCQCKNIIQVQLNYCPLNASYHERTLFCMLLHHEE